MGNPFKELEHNKEVPKHIRKKVMGEIAEIKFLIDSVKFVFIQLCFRGKKLF